MRLYEVVNKEETEETFKRLFNYDGEYSIDLDTNKISCLTLSRVRAALKMTKLPISFDTVVGGMTLDSIGLITLYGSPNKIGGYFNCSHNKLQNLIGGPKEVGGEYSCVNNPLRSLEGLPTKINGHITLTYNASLPLLRILFVEELQEAVFRRGGHGETAVHNIEEILFKYLRQGKRGALLAAAELSRAGFKGNARL